MTASVQLAPLAKLRFCDSNGNPLVGGKLFTYQAGTTTKQNTYTDASGSTPNSNPVILDGRGEASIWFDQSLSYKVVLSPSTDTDPPTSPYWTIDNIVSTQSALSNPANGYGADLVGGVGRVLSSVAAISGLLKTGVQHAFITSYYGDGKGGGGPIYLDPADTTSAANGGTIFVAADGGRWKRPVSDRITAAQFGCDITGSTDCATNLANFVAFVGANVTRIKGVFESGVYLYATSPNFAVQNAVFEAEGEVRLRYTGTGNAVIFDGGATTTSVYNVKFIGNFIVEAPATAGHGYFVRGVHHSRIEGRVDGCGSTGAALCTNFCVCTEFNVKASVNEQSWYLGATPKYGYYIDKRNAGELTSACSFAMPILEGIGGDGIYLANAVNCVFTSGTSEGNTGRGIYISSASGRNTFIGIDVEANTGNSIEVGGFDNKLINLVASGTVVIDSGAANNSFEGGEYNAITNSGLATSLEDLRYGSSGGVLTGFGSSCTKRGVYSISGATFDPDQNLNDLVSYTNIPNNTATVVLTFPSAFSNEGFYNVVASYQQINDATNYRCWAVVYHDGSALSIVTQQNGATMTMTAAGLTIKLTQTSGATINNVYAKAAQI